MVYYLTMNLKTYLTKLTLKERAVFAESIGTSAGHLTNVSYGYKVLDVKSCVALEQATAGEVTRQELRPADWQQIWPELATPSQATNTGA